MVRKKDPEFTLDRDVIFNTLEEGIIAINTQAEVIYINRSAAEMLNTTEEAAIGRRCPLSIRHLRWRGFWKQGRQKIMSPCFP